LALVTSISLQVAGLNGVSASGVTAVVLNVTVTAPTTAGYITVDADCPYFDRIEV
jgi:hypothetical protein